ncbi:MAG TPA: hypothetical protein VGV85_10865, partial [Longimicrobiaceae bacterium]|nr:hypothetical protein [Longimicrobiaceae bacterium]
GNGGGEGGAGGDDTAGERGMDRFGGGAKPVVETPPALSPDAPGMPSVADPAHQTDPTGAE